MGLTSVTSDQAHDLGKPVGLTMQNANTTVTVAGQPLPTCLARSRAV